MKPRVTRYMTNGDSSHIQAAHTRSRNHIPTIELCVVRHQNTAHQGAFDANCPACNELAARLQKAGK